MTTNRIFLVLPLLVVVSVGAAQPAGVEVSAEVVLERHNTVGGWEIKASLAREPASGKAWLELYVTDYGNVGKKTLDIGRLDLQVDGRELPLVCGEAEDAELFGGGLLIQNTHSTHVCALEPSALELLLAARQIQSTVEVQGKLRKPREWSPKAVEKLKSLKPGRA